MIMARVICYREQRFDFRESPPPLPVKSSWDLIKESRIT